MVDGSMKKYARLMEINGSIAIVLPKEVEREVGISINSPVSIEVNGNRIIANVEISKVEMNVIKKLLGYKFEERTKKLIDEKFTPAQKKILRDLIKRRVIVAYKSEKYKEEVYSVPKKIYEILVNFGIVKKEKKEETREEKIKEEVKEIKEDKLGNLIAFKEGKNNWFCLIFSHTILFFCISLIVAMLIIAYIIK